MQKRGAGAENIVEEECCHEQRECVQSVQLHELWCVDMHAKTWSLHGAFRM